MKVLSGGTKVKSVSPVGVRALGVSVDSMDVGKPPRFRQLKTLADTAKNHSWTQATVDAIARSVVGPGWRLVKVNDDATDEQREELEGFFRGGSRSFTNIKDYMSDATRIYQSIAAFRVFGQVAWEVYRDARGRPVGFDVLSGFVDPQVAPDGTLMDDAFVFYPWSGGEPQTFKAEDVVYFYHPGITGDIHGESVYESLADIVIASDIYASVAYRELFKNVNSPYNGIWVVDEDTSDEDFEMFVSLLEERYTGVENYGRNPLVIRGRADFKEIRSRSREDAPYLEGRRFNQEEISAATGVTGLKMGITSQMSRSNLREARKDFHESVLRPIFRHFESQIYNQVIVRLFGYTGWKFSFNAPDFTSAVEDATIHMRYMQYGVYSPNEVRAQMGEQPREGGDIYYYPSNVVVGNSGDGNPAGEPDMSPDDPARVPTDDEYPDSANVLKELKLWRKHVLRAMDGKRPYRKFERRSIPVELYNEIDYILDKGEAVESRDFDFVKKVFSAAEEVVRGECRSSGEEVALS